MSTAGGGFFSYNQYKAQRNFYGKLLGLSTPQLNIET
jgi:hypothetical protein